MSRSRGVVNDLPARKRLAIVADIKNALIIFFLLCPVRKLAGYHREKRKDLIMQKETFGEFIATVVFFAPLILMMLGVLQ